MLDNTLIKQLVLIGGGHANVQVLKKLTMNKIRGLHTILISEQFEATYSGMTPGYIHRDFNKEEITIDLQRLCYNAGATFIKDKVTGLEIDNQKLDLQRLPSMHYDILSINTGSISKIKGIEIKDRSNYISVKPISSLVEKLHQIDEFVKNKRSKISIIGGGVASYEIAFGLARRHKNNIEISIIGKENLNEKNLNSKTKKKLREIANDFNINEYSGKVISISEKNLTLVNGDIILSDLNLISTGADNEDWLLQSKLSKDDRGFILVDENLLSINNKNIFVTGDACSIKNANKEKSGVIAVRQGEILKENIIFKLMGKPLIKFKPKKNWLYLIGTYQNHALLNYFFLSFHGKWCWDFKKWIDKRFINKFKSSKTMLKKRIFELDSKENIDMYCQGCGSKVSKINLVEYLSSINMNHKLSDSEIIKMEKNNFLQSIDHIKSFSSINPFDFGRISFLHSQNDILSSGGKIKSTSVSIGLPFSKEKVEKFYLEYFMKGIQYESDKDKSIFSSGHSYQTNEPGITLTMNGEIRRFLDKSSAKHEEQIYLSKPLGTGYLLSAYFKNSNLIKINNFIDLRNWMLKDNETASEIAIENNCSVITDVSGFGLASHLGDICENSNLIAEIKITKNILINDNEELINNFKSSGFNNNKNAMLKYLKFKRENVYQNILFDPQTNGPLILSINKNKEEKFISDFKKKCGYTPIKLGFFKKSTDKFLIEIN